MSGTVVIGAGLSGLTVAARLRDAGKDVAVIAKGWGTLHWHAGTIDVLGGYRSGMVTDLTGDLEGFIAEHPDHPYALTGLATMGEALDWLVDATRPTVELKGDLRKNQILISATGGPRPTCLAPRSMASGRHNDTRPTLIVGLDRFTDLSAHLVANNLNEGGGNARGVDVVVPGITDRAFVTGVTIAQGLDDPSLRARLIQMVRPYVGVAERVGFPAVLGLRSHREVLDELETGLGTEVFEIPVIPPSVPGMRLHHALRDRIGFTRVREGMEAVGVDTDGDRITKVVTEAAGRPHEVHGDHFVLATGGILGGGIVAKGDGSLVEVVTGLPVTGPETRFEWFRADFADEQGHPVYRSGVTVGENFLPEEGPRNVTVVGHGLYGADTVREKSLEGVALATGYKAADVLTGGLIHR